MLDIISALIGFIGIALLAWGAYLILPAAGFITLGVCLVSFSFLLSRAVAFSKQQGKK